MRKHNKPNTLDAKTALDVKRAKEEPLKDLTGTEVKDQDFESAPRSKVPAFVKTKQFKALQSQWYKKLKKSGFEDIEARAIETDSTSAVMLNGITAPLAHKLIQAGNAEYYRMFDAFLWHSSPKSTSPKDKRIHRIVLIIVQGHTSGDSLDVIAKTLNKSRLKNPWKVQTVTKKPEWSKAYVYRIYDRVVKPWVKQFNIEHPMGTQYQGPVQDAHVDDVMLKEPKGSKAD